MNAPERLPLVDIQSQIDTRQIAIQAVGIKGVRYPLNIRADGASVATVANWALTVGLASTVRGTHMSRFIELLEAWHTRSLDIGCFATMLAEMLMRLDATSGTLEARFPYFIRKAAPVSGVESLLDVEVCWRCTMAPRQAPKLEMQVVVAATSLCPCSKEISAYGAHNQRSHITIDVALADAMSIEALVLVAEQSASCEVYGLLKRADEKYVTEKAYDNPKFVEDLARDVAKALRADARIGRFTVEVENFESIHNHSAFARVSTDDLC